MRRRTGPLVSTSRRQAGRLGRSKGGLNGPLVSIDRGFIHNLVSIERGFTHDRVSIERSFIHNLVSTEASPIRHLVSIERSFIHNRVSTEASPIRGLVRRQEGALDSGLRGGHPRGLVGIRRVAEGGAIVQTEVVPSVRIAIVVLPRVVPLELLAPQLVQQRLLVAPRLAAGRSRPSGRSGRRRRGDLYMPAPPGRYARRWSALRAPTDPTAPPAPATPGAPPAPASSPWT